MNTKKVDVEKIAINVTDLMNLHSTIKKIDCCKDSLIELIDCARIQFQKLKEEADIKVLSR